MKFLGAEVQFKSQPIAYWIEKSGEKNHTERLLTTKEEEWLKEHNVERIRIAKAGGSSSMFFTRQITNIYKGGNILGFSLYSFTWKHDTATDVQK